MEKTFIEWVKTENSKSTMTSKLDFKVKCFEYFVFLLIKKSENIDELKSMNLTALKVQLLLFFTVCSSDKLLAVFDNWKAMPFGSIESDIYQYISKNKGEFSFFKLTRFGLELKSIPSWE